MKLKYTTTPRLRWAFFSWLDIESKTTPGEVYLRRLRVLQTPLFGFYIHWIYERDNDRWPHDHPWNWLSFVLKGGYVQEVFSEDGTRSASVCKRWGFNSLKTNQAHKITAVIPGTVTLFLTGRRKRPWGFWVDNKKENLVLF